MAKFAVVLPAAGKRRRFADKNYKKPFAPLAGRAVWMHSAERFVNRDDVAQVILIVSAEDREEFNRKFSANVAILGIQVVEGGSERSDSVERPWRSCRTRCSLSLFTMRPGRALRISPSTRSLQQPSGMVPRS